MQPWSMKKGKAVQTKIATCNYCGTRAALVLTGKVQHELACSACGAPLHDFKQMPVERAPKKSSFEVRPKKAKPKKNKYRKKKRKSIFEDAFDLIEDIFD